MPLHPIPDELFKKDRTPTASKDMKRKYLLPEDMFGPVSTCTRGLADAAVSREEVGWEQGPAPQNPALQRLRSCGQRAHW